MTRRIRNSAETADTARLVGVVPMVMRLIRSEMRAHDVYALEERRKRGLEAADAIIEACRIRFRPIMMTTLAAIIGTLPIALGIGSGAQSRQSLGITIVGGPLFSQLL